MRYSWGSGRCHIDSPARWAASRTWPIQGSSLPIIPAIFIPRATTQAPVRVARSMTASGFSSAASDSPSARISRPSASVLRTSTVLPLRILSTSPGLMALGPGMFSVVGTNPMTFDCTPAVRSTDIAPMTAAAPDMSVFIVSMPSAVLSDRPPESKVMPFPTRATVPVALPLGV